MRRLRRIAGGMMAVVALVGIVVVGPATVSSAPTASATESVDMNLACQHTYGNDSWLGYLPSGSNDVMDWRCWNRAWPFQSNAGVQIDPWCYDTFGLHAYYSNFNNPYTWYCG